MHITEFWKFLAGLGIFLLGLRQLEEALKALAGRPFKKFLRKQTTSPLRGVLTGIGVTGVLQSSTLVSVMMVAFVGAGILTLENAIGVIFGSNLGTTTTGWIMAALGFKLDIARFAYPLVGIGAVCLVFFEHREKISETGRLILGFGFLFVGLAFMKEIFDGISDNLDISMFAGFSPYLFYPVGILLAGMIHSGSVVVVMALSALSAGLIPLEAAAALAIGGDLGKTSTAILGSLKGIPAQKRVAASHFIFNLVTNGIALALLYPLTWLIHEGLGVNTLFSLVAFHSGVNFLGILVLFGFIGILSRFLYQRFKGRMVTTKFISKVPVDVPEAATEALHNEILHLADRVIALNIRGLRFDTDTITVDPTVIKDMKSGTYEDHYEELKQLQGETVKYFVSIQNQKLDPEDSGELNRHAHALRHLLKSAKRLKNVVHNIRDFEDSGNDVKHGLFELLRTRLTDLYKNIHNLLHTGEKSQYTKLLTQLVKANRQVYENVMKESYTQAHAGNLSEVEIATFQNANHEIYSANKALLEALGNVLLTDQDAEEFNALHELD